MSKLTGQVALVTGGGRGLGRAYAIALAKAGAAVAVTARTVTEIQAVQHEIAQNGGKIFQLPKIGAKANRVQNAQHHW